MKKIGLFWGSTSGNTEIAVEFMEEYLRDEGFEVDSFNVADTDPEKMSINPDCGFFQLPRWLAYKKLQALVAGTQIVRSEL